MKIFHGGPGNPDAISTALPTLTVHPSKQEH